MADYTNGLKDIETVVTEWMLKYKRPTEDYPLYVTHACDCVRNFSLYDGQLVITQKMTVNTTLKCIDFPSDFQSFVDLVSPYKGQWWSFTNKDRIVNTTTMVGLVETRDSDVGEGVTIDQPRVTSYGARGAYNVLKYTIDYAARRIYFDSDVPDPVVLMYVGSGVKTTDATTIPDFVTPMIDTYLLWKESYWISDKARERNMLEQDYNNAHMHVRHLVNSMSANEWLDLFYGSFTQTPKR